MNTETADSTRVTGGASSLRAAVFTAGVVAALSAIALVILSLAASPVDARSTGLVGASGNPSSGGSTCASCHGVGELPPVVNISGPPLVSAGETNIFTVDVFAPGAAVAGFNASITGFAGAMDAPGTGEQVLAREVTHTTPQAFDDGGMATFTFDWSAPAINTQLTMYTAAVAANGNGQNGDDATGVTSFPITIVGGLDEVEVATSCVDGSGQFDITVRNPWGSIADYEIDVDGFGPIDVTLLANSTDVTTVSVVPDDEIQITVTREDDFVAYDSEQEVFCGVPGDPIAGADGPIEVSHVVSCLAGNGRIDTNIINTGVGAAIYRLEFQGLTPRALTVAAGDWWRMPITGRFDGDYEVIVKRDGTTVSTQTVTVSCDTDPPILDAPEIQVVNACRAGSGYLLLQFVNDSAQAKPYVIAFGSPGVPNRSTTAAAYGQTIRAITGRPNGDWEITVTSNNVLVESFDVSVTCP